MWGPNNSRKFLEENNFYDFIPVWEACIEKVNDLGIDYKYGVGRVHLIIALKYGNLSIIGIQVDGTV